MQIGDEIVAALAEVLSEARRGKHLTLDGLAEISGAHRTTLGLIERGERGVTVSMAAQIALALGGRLSTFLAMAEGKVLKSEARETKNEHYLNEDKLKEITGLSPAMLKAGMDSCYQIIDIIDEQMVAHSGPRLAKLVELANFSSMLGNLLRAEIAAASGGMYKGNKPHTYPDLIPQRPDAYNLEIKTALEKNLPKGHLPKPGRHITFRYVLSNNDGTYTKGVDQRGDVARIWEIRVGELTESDFNISNTAGDSGKTAVVKGDAFKRMAIVYFAPDYFPYSNVQRFKDDNPVSFA